MAGQPGRTSSTTPNRKGKAAAARVVAKPTVLGRVFARPGIIVAGASFAAVMTGIVANALVLQKGHHPSPLFSPAAVEMPASVPMPPPAPRQALEQSAPVPVAAPLEAPVAPAPAAQPAPAPATPHAARPATTHPVAASHPAPVAHKAPVAAHKAAPASHKDPIAQLLGKTQ